MEKIQLLLDRLTAEIFGVKFGIQVQEDLIYSSDKGARLFIQVVYESKCTETQEMKQWKSAKYYLSEYMTDDEVVKTAYKAFKTAVEHEMMEGFKVDDIRLFNPHTDFEELLKVSKREVKRGSSTGVYKLHKDSNKYIECYEGTWLVAVRDAVFGVTPDSNRVDLINKDSIISKGEIVYETEEHWKWRSKKSGATIILLFGNKNYENYRLYDFRELTKEEVNKYVKKTT